MPASLSIPESFSKNKFLFDSSSKGTQPWRGDEIKINLYFFFYLYLKGKFKTSHVNSCLAYLDFPVIFVFLPLTDNRSFTICSYLLLTVASCSALPTPLFFYFVLSPSQAEEVRQVHVPLGRRW